MFRQPVEHNARNVLMQRLCLRQTGLAENPVWIPVTLSNMLIVRVCHCVHDSLNTIRTAACDHVLTDLHPC